MRLLRTALVLGPLLVALPLAGAQSDTYAPETEEQTLAPGFHVYYELDGKTGVTRYDFLIEASSPVDILLFSQSQYQAYKSNAGSYYVTEAFTQETSVRHIFELPSKDPFVLVIDNSDSPVGGAPGNTNVALRTGYIALTPRATAGGMDDFLRTLFLRQDYWQVPFVTGVAVAGPTLIFFFLALLAAAIAQVNDEEQGYWWLSVTILTVIGAAFTIVVPGVGFFLDTRWLTIPAAIYGYLTYRRTADTTVSIAAVFSVAFFASLVGVDVLNEIMHHSEFVQDYYYTGATGVFGGAGWGDLLIIAPLVGVGTFFLWFRLGTSHTRLDVEASLQGDTQDGTLFLKVTNLGEHAARNVQIEALFQGHGLPDTIIEEGLLIEELPAGHETTRSIQQPGRVVEVDAAWDAIHASAWADNARRAGEQILLSTTTPSSESN